jgi:hypothetical protein
MTPLEREIFLPKMGHHVAKKLLGPDDNPTVETQNKNRDAKTVNPPYLENYLDDPIFISPVDSAHRAVQNLLV